MLDIPKLGYNTIQLPANKMEEMITIAVEKEIRHIDAGHTPDNEILVGKAISSVISKGLIKREGLFVTASLPTSDFHPQKVKSMLEASLNRLNLKYVDLYLIHWPNVTLDENHPGPAKDVREAIVETWKAMESVCESKLAKRIGVCNFLPSDIKPILDNCKIKPAVNQIGVNVFKSHKKVVEYFKSHDIQVMSHSPFGVNESSITLFQYPTVVKIAKDLNAAPGQILINWAIQTCGSVIFRAPKDAYISEDSMLMNIPKEHMDTLDRIHERFSQ